VAVHTQIPEPALFALWGDYRKLIIWNDVPLILDGNGMEGCDSKDVPYVALQRLINAVGILSRDNDIVDLGGNLVTLDFVLSVRTYARAASYAVGIRVGGVFVTSVSFELLAQLVKTISVSIARLPPAVKLALIASAAFVAMHPRTRERVLDSLSSIGKLAVDAWPVIVTLMETASQKQALAKTALCETEKLLEMSRTATSDGRD
jgi:hypothetical protein